MKMVILLFAMFIGSCSSAVNTINVYGNGISLNSECAIEYSSIVSKPLFISVGECRFVTHAGTDIVKTIFVAGGYVFIVENNMNDGAKCRSQYTAMGVGRQGDIKFSKHVKQSLTCNQSFDQHAFEYFAAKLFKT